MEENYKKAADIIKKSKNLIALTGAGHSVESGIPDFRGKDGLWTKYDPMVYAHIDMFRLHPEKSWEMLAGMLELTGTAKPNAAHFALARLEELGFLKAVITQNVDNLHQEAGSKKVIEFHGNDKHLECLDCGRIYDTSEFQITKKTPPVCKKCTSILKPTVVFFGENIPVKALARVNAFCGYSRCGNGHRNISFGLPCGFNSLQGERTRCSDNRDES